MRAWISQIRKGVVELCVLASIKDGEAYGYQILQRLANVQDLAITESTIYPLLSRLTTDGMLSVRSVASTEGPPRRYYRLTPLGRARLKQMGVYWKDLQLSVNSMLEEGKD